MSTTPHRFSKRKAAIGFVAVFALLGFAIYVVPALPFVPRSTADLKFSVIDKVGKPLVCTGWGMPNPPANPYGEYPRIVADVPTYLAIIRREHLAPTPLTNEQVVTVYRDWLELNAVRLTWDGSAYAFDVFPGPTPSAGLRNDVVGRVDIFGNVSNVHRGSALGACPICLEGDSLVSTPDGPIPVSKIAIGMRVWTADAQRRPTDATVLDVQRRLAVPGSELIHVVLADGRDITASPPHELADGRPVGALKVGDTVEGSAVTRVETVDWSLALTFDLLPSGLYGEYWVNGILLRSTLSSGAHS